MLSEARAAANRSSSSSSSSYSSPFTATQWQELEHQALIYKYMVSGVAIPPELLLSVKRSLDSSLASIGWGCFQVGFGKKGVVDPEPGRCRRTDGKKWRCSKEAYPGSKYCDRHMHRGKNRSRKHVEISSSSSSSSHSTTTSSSSVSASTANNGYYSTNPYNLTAYNSTISSSTTPLNGQNFLNSSTLLYSNDSNSSPSYSHHHNHHPASDRDYRYLQGMREDHQLHQSQYGSSTQAEFDSFYSYPSSKQDYQQHQQHCFVLGADFKSSSSSSTLAINRPLMKMEESSNNNTDMPSSSAAAAAASHKPMHHFFGLGGGGADSWLDLASSSRPS